MKTRHIGLSVLVLMLTSCGTAMKGLMAIHPEAKKRFDYPKFDRQTTGSAWFETIGQGENQIRVLHIKATNHFARGFLYAKALGPEIRTAYDEAVGGISKLFYRKAPKALAGIMPSACVDQSVKAVLGKAWKMMENSTPWEDLEEMEGLYAGLVAIGIRDISLKEIHQIHAIPDFGETSCSALFATGAATVRGETFQMRLLDYGSELGLDKRPLVTVYHAGRPGEKTYVNIGWVGLIGVISGVNDQGVCISEMGMGNRPGETLRGTPMPFLLKQCLRYSSKTEEAVATITSARRNNWYVYLVGDKEGSGEGLVTSAQGCIFYPLNGQSEIRERGRKGREVVMPQYKDSLYAGHFGEKQSKSMSEIQGRVDLERVKGMARLIGAKSNLQTVIFNLTTGDTWIANREGERRASDCEYVLLPKSSWQ